MGVDRSRVTGNPPKLWHRRADDGCEEERIVDCPERPMKCGRGSSTKWIENSLHQVRLETVCLRRSQHHDSNRPEMSQRPMRKRIRYLRLFSILRLLRHGQAGRRGVPNTQDALRKEEFCAEVLRWFKGTLAIRARKKPTAPRETSVRFTTFPEPFPGKLHTGAVFD